MDKLPWVKPVLITLFDDTTEGKVISSSEFYNCHYHKVAGRRASKARVRTSIASGCASTFMNGRFVLEGSSVATTTFAPS